MLSVNIQIITPSTASNWVCCTSINSTGLIKRKKKNIKNVYDHAKWLHSLEQGNPNVDSIWTRVKVATECNLGFTPA